MAKLLVDAGADPTVPGWMQLTALHQSENRKRGDGPRVHELLCAHRNDGMAQALTAKRRSQDSLYVKKYLVKWKKTGAAKQIESIRSNTPPWPTTSVP